MAVRTVEAVSSPRVASQHAANPPGNSELRFWVQLIEHLNCREVLILDAFGFLADRPTFAKQLFDRLTASGHRMAVWRHFEPSTVVSLPVPIHRLTIIVPIVMKPSDSGERNKRRLSELFKQLATGTNFWQHYSWLFLLEATLYDAQIQRFLRLLPIRPDSNVYTVRYCSDDRWFERVHLEWPSETDTRTVREQRMQMIHPETREPRVQVYDRWLRSSNDGNREEKSDQQPHPRRACGSLQQLYRLPTRLRTIDVSVELGVMEQGGEKMIILSPRPVEQRNDFFNLEPGISIMVYSAVDQNIAPMEVAQSITLFRNVRTTIVPYKIDFKLRLTDFQFRLAIVNGIYSSPTARSRYSTPLFHELINVYISHQSADHGELMADFMEIVLQPVLLMLVLFSFSFWIAFNCAIKYGPGNRQQRKLSMADSLICFVGVVAQQGSIVRPNSLATMLIIFVGLSICYITYCCFLTRITSLLSVDVNKWDNLEGLLAANEYSIGYIGGLTDTSKLMHNPSIAEVLRRTERDATLPVGTLAAGLQRVLSSKYGLLASQSVARRVIANLFANQSCAITEISEHGLCQLISIHVEPFDGYKKMINLEILRHYSNGAINRLQEKFISHSKSCIKTKVFDYIEMDHLRLPMIMMLASIVFSAFVLVMEVAYYRFRLYRNRRATGFIEFCN